MKLTTLPFFLVLSAFNSASAAEGLLRKNGRALNGYFACGTTTFCVRDRATCENDSVCRCLDGYSGPMCEPEDECATSSPCVENARCSDHFPPEKFRCACDVGTIAVLPDAADVSDPVPPSWRPLSCIKENPVEDTQAPVPAAPVAATPVTPSPAVVTPVPLAAGSCNTDADCSNTNFLKCNTSTSKCVCPSGFVKVGGACQLENECRAGFSNGCHRNAVCTNNRSTPGFSCACSSGFVDANPTVEQAGTNCAQENECLTGTHDCPSTKTCADRFPPQMFDCVEPTPAPTMKPTPRPTAPRPLPPPTDAPVTPGV